jgi:hypothetical protein
MKKKDLHSKKGFNTPENYFDNFQDRLFEKLSDEHSLHTPILDSIKTDGFKLPEQYFKKFPEQIAQKTNNKPSKLIVMHTFKRYYGVVASAAAILLMFVGVYYGQLKTDSTNDLAYEDLDVYVNQDLAYLNSYDLADLLEIDTAIIETLHSPEYQEEEIDDFLNDELENYEQLIIEN